MKKNILVWGSGFVASHLQYEQIKSRAIPDRSIICSILAAYKADVLINTMGYCGEKNIDDCLNNKEKTIYANTILPTMIANECNKMGIQYIHIGSGCIFGGPSPHTLIQGDMANPTKTDTGFTEDDFANPPSFYAETKYAADLAINKLPNTTILRIRMPLSSQFSPRNLISKLRGYPSIIDVENSMTFLSDLVRCIDWSIEKNKTGIYNCVSPKPLTAVKIMNEYQKYFPTTQFNIINLTQLAKLTKDGRSNCILDGHKLQQEGFEMTPTDEALKQTMSAYVKNMEKNV